eukprot:6456283-Amphidinium_carterae.1
MSRRDCHRSGIQRSPQRSSWPGKGSVFRGAAARHAGRACSYHSSTRANLLRQLTPGTANVVL